MNIPFDKVGYGLSRNKSIFTVGLICANIYSDLSYINKLLSYEYIRCQEWHPRGTSAIKVFLNRQFNYGCSLDLSLAES